MIVTARASHVPHPPRKVELIAASVLGKKASVALTALEFTPKAAAGIVIKVIKQAIANAKTNFKLDPDSLYVDEIFATKGKSWKKVRFAGRGRRRMYEKTTAHLTVRLASKEVSKSKNITPKK